MTNYILGIDGGGSKTDFLLCDTELNEVARLVAGRSNPNDIGIEQTTALICENTQKLLLDNNIDKSSVVAVFAGIAGITSDVYAKPVESVLKSVLPEAKSEVSHDGINVLYGAFPFSDGVSIICGTGSSCFVKKNGNIYRIGGYGSFDLCGNGYEIGRSAIAHALKTADGRDKRGILEQLLEKKLGTDAITALDRLVLMTKDEIAAFAPTVFEAAEKGDKTAMMIIFENISYIAELIDRASLYFEGDLSVALAGGILKAEMAFNMLEGMVDSRVNLIKSERAPSFGAAAKAKQL